MGFHLSPGKRQRQKSASERAVRRLSFENLEVRTLMTAAPYPLAPPTIAEISRDRSSPGFNFVFRGSADPFLKVSVVQAGGGLVGQTTVNANGQWTLTYRGARMINGDFRFRAIAADKAGVVSVPSAGSMYRPNFVLVNTDDMAAHDLAFMRRVNNLLVNSGTNFSNSFVPTALSGPSRASLLTGLYAHSTGMLENASPLGGEVNIDRSSTLATWLKSAGYETAAFGKSVTVSENLESLVRSRPPAGWDQFSTGSHEGYVLFRDGVKSLYDYQEHNSTDLWANMADSFIRESRRDSQPFFLYLASNISHQPYKPLPRHAGTMSNVPKWRPPSYNVVPRDVPGRSPIRNVAQGDLQRQQHLETLQAVDEAVAKVYHALAQTGELDNTVFVFTSDNGMMWGEHGLISTKGNFYDESLRVPLVIRDGRAPLAKAASQTVLNIDIAPTFARMAGAHPGHRPDGVDISRVVHGSTAPVRQSFLIQHKWMEGWNYVKQYGRGGVGIRTDYWKYVEYESGKVDLFNLKQDPYEMRNLGADPAFAWVRQTLAPRLAALRPTDRTGPVIVDLAHGIETDSRGVQYLRITGAVSDIGKGGSAVRTPEYFVGALGLPGWGKGLDTADGLFNSSRETFRGRIRVDTLNQLGIGAHTIFVRGRDVAGNWGRAVAFTYHVTAGMQRQMVDADAAPELPPFVDWVEDSASFMSFDPAIADGEEAVLLRSTENSFTADQNVMIFNDETPAPWEADVAVDDAWEFLEDPDFIGMISGSAFGNGPP